MKKHITFLALAAYLVSVLTACGGTGAAADTTAPEVSGSVTTLSDEIPCPVEKSDFGGKEFRILYPEWFLYIDYFFVDEQSGDQMDDAIYKRTIETEEYLNVKITPKPISSINDIAGKVQEVVLAGDDAYDMVLTHCISGVGTMAAEGYLYDWTTLPDGVTFDERWWNEDMNRQLELNGKRYYTVSDFMLPDPNAILFNKRMVEEYKLESPYQLVYDGKWTWDKMTEMARKVTKDVDGNSVYDENDIYGFAAQAEWKMISIPYACDQYIVQKNGSKYELALKNEKMLNIIDKMNKLFNSDNSSFIWVASGNVMTTGIITDRVLFDLAALNDSAIYRDSDVNFGILPFPKYDEAQKEYISLNWCGLMCIPNTVSQTELLSKTCEMLAYASDDTTQPAYREVLLGDKLARDDESVGMLDIIFDGLVCDFGLNYLGFNNLTYTIPRMVGRDKSTDFASWYDTNINTVQKTLDDLNEKLMS
ncbi:MAG: extracellular solute-binding protein [Clostridia bacterium]|nr:extracellular solute-binding protein [Clostridia bacterium]